MLGGMLFRSLGFGGMGGGFGGGIGLFEILLMAGIAYGIYVFVKRRREQAYATQTSQAFSASDYSRPNGYDYSNGSERSRALQPDVDRGIENIRMMDPRFDEKGFLDQCSDFFFKIQAGWMNRDVNALTPLLTGEMVDSFSSQIGELKRDKKINRLENIAVRSVEIREAWQEQGQDFVTVRFYANLLDYTVDEMSMQVLSGSKTEPQKFEEYWTFTRSVGSQPWRLSAIQQS
jgi:predicted lipid-binding transport protein (Tim44 family)